VRNLIQRKMHPSWLFLTKTQQNRVWPSSGEKETIPGVRIQPLKALLPSVRNYAKTAKLPNECIRILPGLHLAGYNSAMQLTPQSLLHPRLRTTHQVEPCRKEPVKNLDERCCVAPRMSLDVPYPAPTVWPPSAQSSGETSTSQDWQCRGQRPMHQDVASPTRTRRNQVCMQIVRTAMRPNEQLPRRTPNCPIEQKLSKTMRSPNGGSREQQEPSPISRSAAKKRRSRSMQNQAPKRKSPCGSCPRGTLMILGEPHFGVTRTSRDV
jgi:hypothetical protein